MVFLGTKRRPLWPERLSEGQVGRRGWWAGVFFPGGGGKPVGFLAGSYYGWVPVSRSSPLGSVGNGVAGQRGAGRPEAPAAIWEGEGGVWSGEVLEAMGGTPGQDEPRSLTPTFQDVGDTGGPRGAGKPGKVRCSFLAHSVARGLQAKVWDSVGHYLQRRCISEARGCGCWGNVPWGVLTRDGGCAPGEPGLGWGGGRIPLGGRLGDGDKSGQWSAVSRATSQVRHRKGHASKASRVEGLASRWMNRHGTSVCWHRVHVILL